MNPEKLAKALETLAGVRLAIVGDLMLDEYVWGEVSRISPDAPVQVVEVRRRTHAAGGAANVARNIVSAGSEAVLFGVVGNDPAGKDLVGLLRASGVVTDGILEEPGRPTTVKTRVIARNQHVLRLDEEVKRPLLPATRRRLIERLASVLPRCAGVLVSDYAKGVVDETLVREIAALAARSAPSIPIVVDPKAADFSRYLGCTAITPNQTESETASRLVMSRDEEVRQAAELLRKTCGADLVLITRGEKGMVLCGPGGSLDAIPTRAREVYDVTGAGDTVLAYFGLGLSAGFPALDAAVVSNMAAGIAVGKVGTTIVDRAEILATELGAAGGPGKIVPRREAGARTIHEHALGRRVVFTNGCFDLLHAGHVHLLERARAMGDFLIVAINSNASVRRLKGEGRPLVGEGDRARVLAALDAVDMVVVFEEDTPLELIRDLRPDVLVKGGDYTTETIVGHEMVEGWGGRVETIPLVGGRSTSAIISAIRAAGDK